MTTTGSVQAEDRLARIVELLDRDGALTLEVVAEQLGVSSMTVRRDLDRLESEGVLRRVRGGAVAIPRPQPFGERRAVRANAKRVMAEKALEFLPVGGAIALDASTTTGTLATRLKDRPGLTVVTNSYENFVAIGEGATPSRLLVGGEVEPETGSFVGQLASEMARSLLYRVFFSSAAAIDHLHGTSEVSIAESQVKRAFASKAEKIVLCVDSSKLGQRAVAPAFGLAEISVLVTELDPGDPRLDAYRELVELR